MTYEERKTILDSATEISSAKWAEMFGRVIPISPMRDGAGFWALNPRLGKWLRVRRADLNTVGNTNVEHATIGGAR